MNEQRVPVKISRGEFEAIAPLGRRGSTDKPEWQLLRTLDANEGLKIKCHWTHYGTTCAGSAPAHRVAKQCGIQITTYCHQGTFYLLRLL